MPPNSSNPHLTPEFEAKVQATIARQAQEDHAGRQAASVPFPGVLNDVFGVPAHVKCGNRQVRPFYDCDVELLAFLKHPVQEMISNALDGNDSDLAWLKMPRGPKAWQLAWMFTHTIDEAEAAVADGTLDAKSKEMCKEMQLGELQALVVAVVHQVGRYWAPVTGHGGDSKENPSSAAPSTATDGSSTNAAV